MARQRSKRKRAIRHPRRRGIVLLIIISVLVLFMLMLVTFAVVSGHYRDAARSFAYRRAAATLDTKVELDSVMVQVLADADSPSSSLWGHGLLTDLYGDSVRGTMSNISSSATSPFIQFDGTTATSPYFSTRLSNITGYHAGCVLTMVNGPCAGLSTRVVYSEPLDPNDVNTSVRLRIETFENGLVPAAGNTFIINGKPFNGTGVGQRADGSYANDRIGDTMNDSDATNDVEWALVPHLAGWKNRTNAKTSLSGGADEPWDAFDYQNMFLTAVDPVTGKIYPAFHRPDLINYWEQRLNALTPPQTILYPNDTTNFVYNANLARQVMFRPLGGFNGMDHPNFNGNSAFIPGNAGYDPLGNSGNVWDVDNDGDGVMDSIWIDPGLPIATAPDGRKYKRLVATMIRDLDSRIHVNAHGTSEFAKAFARPEDPISGPLAGNGVGTALGNVPRGLGYGPAEINFLNLFQLSGETSAAAALSYTRLLQGTDGSTGQAIPGRYGLDGAITNGTTNAMLNRRPGLAGPTNSVAVSNDPLSVIKTQGFGLSYAAGVFSNYASPSDVWGRGAFALDYTGQPYPFYQGQNTDWLGDTTQQTVEINDNPYEINLLSPSSSADTPYNIAELERVLRRNDPDVNGLPDRLSTALQNNARRASVVSTISSHIPAPRGAVPRYMRKDTAAITTYGTVAPSVLDVALARIMAETPTSSFPSLPVYQPNPAQANSYWQSTLKQIMPFELFHGQMFDLNRPFGNGVDDDGNGVVDEPGEIQPADGIDNNGNSTTDEAGEVNKERMWTAGVYTGTFGDVLNGAKQNWWQAPATAPFNDPNYLGYLDLDKHLYARQLYARNLYCLALLYCDPSYYQNLPVTETLTPVQKQKLWCRRLAQWAINVVDARDSDAIMTPFEYDENPFDGWHVDGNISTDESAAPLNLATRGLVWGMEYPDLQLTESLAFHNRRVKDTAHDPNQRKRDGGTPDPDLDQYGIPQGSLFLELYCARNLTTSNPKLPMELYDPTGGLDLGRLSPARGYAGNTVRHPVWRTVVTSNPPNGGSTQSLYSLVGSKPDTTVMEPATTGVTIERVIWFSPLDPTNTPEQNLVFFERTGTLPNVGSAAANQQVGSTVLVGPGQYAVAAPRVDTRLGSLIDGPDTDPNTHDLSPHMFGVAGNLFTTSGGTTPNNGFSPYPPDGNAIRPVVGLVCAAKPPASWGNQARQVGMNISEPLPNPSSGSYYAEPDAGDNYADLSMPFVPMDNELPNEPFDNDATYGGPLFDDTTNGVRTGTREDFRSIFVQRLANPLLPWNPLPNDPQFGATGTVAVAYNAGLPINPYITIDWSTLDLTVFAGDEDTNRKTGSGEWIDPSDEDPFNTAADPKEKFAGRERGISSGSPDRRFWKNVVRALPATDASAGYTDHYWDRKPQHTLGYLNSALSPRWNPAPTPGYEGSPQTPFPWLTWNNRPFANPMELLMVPTSASPSFGVEFAYGHSETNTNPYSVASNDGYGEPAYEGNFRHLLSFFSATDANSGVPLADLYRLFDAMETPSPYVGTEQWYQPNQVASGTPGEGYRAPFNKLSRFRDPGRININTMTDPLVWDALMATYPDFQTTSGSGKWNDVIGSRRGDGSPNILTLPAGTPPFPTVMANPFRPADAADLMPLSVMQQPRAIDATLMRSELGGTLPLFENRSHHYVNQTTDAYRATDRNAYFRYQPYAKLANMVTTNSNTFAVWETIGYFEVSANPGGVDIAHPDGYQLGAEMRFEDGGTRRPRAFYIIDRSIPAAFEPGQAHNVERCVLQRRYLEY